MSDKGTENQIAIFAIFERARMCRCADGTALKKLRPGMMRDWMTAPLTAVSRDRESFWVCKIHGDSTTVR